MPVKQICDACLLSKLRPEACKFYLRRRAAVAAAVGVDEVPRPPVQLVLPFFSDGDDQVTRSS
jgi:hypothetical protein